MFWVSSFWNFGIKLDDKNDYFPVSENLPIKASEFWLGNKLELISDAGEETAVRLWMFHGGILNYFYSNGYLCYQTQYSGPFKVLEKRWDNQKLYICNLTEKRRPEKIIENVYRYFLCEERLIYEDTSGDLYYQCH